MPSRRLLLAGAALGLSGALLAWRAWRHRTPAVPARAAPHLPDPDLPGMTLVRDELPLPVFELQGTTGPFAKAQLAGRWTFLFFGYTHCPDVCPTTLSTLATVMGKVSASTPPQVVFVTLDPERDTLALLKQYVPAFHPAFVGALGSGEAMAPLVKHLGVGSVRNPLSTPGQYTVDHTASIFFIDPQARLHAVFSHPAEVEVLARAYRKFAGS